MLISNKRCKKETTMFSKVFLVFNTACFGDNLICNSLCQNIKRIYPDSKIVFIADKPFYEAAKYQKDVDDVIIYDKKGKNKGIFGFLKFISDFPYKNAYAAFITYKNMRNRFIAMLIGTKHIFESKKSNQNLPMQLQILSLLNKLTKAPLNNVAIKYNAGKELPEHLKTYFKSDKNYIAFCTITKNPPKDMHVDTAIETIKKLSSKYKIIYTGAGEKAKNYSEQLKNNGCDFIDLTNKTSIKELASVLKNCSCLVTVDTGTMHLGCAVNVPTVAVFYEKTTIKNWAPDSDLYNIRVITENQNADNIVVNVSKILKETL